MPISTENFEELDEDSITLAEGTNAHKILSFLIRRQGEAFRQSELLDFVDVPPGSIGPTLHRLEERGLTRHRKNYWTVGHESNLGQVAGLKSTFKSINRRYESESRDDWFGDDEQ